MIDTGDVPVVPIPEIVDEPFWKSLKGLSFDEIISKIANGLITFAFHVALAILVFYAGRFIIRKIYKVVFNVMTRKHVDASLTTFVLSLVKMILYFILIITIIGILGLETSSFLALFASAGVAMGMALSGTLQNFAGGVLILLLKPYKVGDFIEVQNYQGTVKSIQLFNTVINTIDNKAIIIPNGMLSTSSINNYSLEQYRRVDWTVSLAYGTDLPSARKTILSILSNDNRIVKKYIEDDWKNRKKMVQERQVEKKKESDPDLEKLIEKRSHLKEMQTANKGWSGLLLKYRIKRIEHKIDKKIGPIPIATNDMEIKIPTKVDRSPRVELMEMADSSINLTVRAWTHSSNYWDLYFKINERLYTELPQKGFEFPFPQLDVHNIPS